MNVPPKKLRKVTKPVAAGQPVKLKAAKQSHVNLRVMSGCTGKLSPVESNSPSASKSTNVQKKVAEMKVPPKKLRKVTKPVAAGQPVKLKAAQPVKPKVPQPVKLASAIKSHVNLPKDPYVK
ncbi:Hypothetical protein CINCED_3A016243, partial [Cinara cedri]